MSRFIYLPTGGVETVPDDLDSYYDQHPRYDRADKPAATPEPAPKPAAPRRKED